MDIDTLIPYLRRLLRVFLYGAIPAVSAWILTSNNADLVASLRVAGAAASLALLDKARNNRQSPWKGAAGKASKGK